MTNSVPTDFAARMEATLVPEPATPFVALVRASEREGVVTWPGWATNFVLESSTTLSHWTPVTTGIGWTDHNFVFTNTTGSGNAFFRLNKP